MRLLKGLLYALLGLGLIIGSVVVAARFGDGPVGPLIGGDLRSGDIVQTPIIDWSFATEREIEMQLVGDSTSRTIWFFPAGDHAYIPAGLSFPPRKSWHVRAAASGRAILRIAGKRYPVRLVRLSNESEEFGQVVARMRREQAVPPGGAEAMWLFIVSSRL